ncbi:MAG: AzlD domain-containing protein [Firmicutes bacterium]|jgi:branched-subunit amino acid transport protein|nr:AzlD domain-containing protein [Bacillota bacterium]NBI62236.1 AzlD domain-containing protein [Clostridiales bacterium]
MSFYIYVAVMAVVTYLIRIVPLVLMDREIKNTFIKSFLYYVPYAALASMTFPAILFSTTELVAAVAGLVVAIFMAFREKGLLLVALGACVTVFAIEQGMALLL